MTSLSAAIEGTLGRLPPHIRAIVLILFATLCFTSMHTVIRYATTTGQIHPFEVAFFRNLFGLLAVLPFALRNGGATFRTRRIKLHALRGIMQVFAMLMFFYALSITPLAKISAVSFTAPLFATLGAIIFLGEKVRMRRIVALILGFTGAMIIVRPGFIELDFGAVLVMTSSSIWACAILIIKSLGRTESSLTITTYQNIFLIPFTLVAAMFFWTWPSWQLLGMFAVMGIFGSLAHVAMAESLKLADATAILPFDFVRLIWASAIGFMVFGEIPEIWTWVGGTVIFASTTYIAFREARLRRLQSAEK
ncbi:MAG: DMT family transporter [Rhodospirillaceae bacterium]|jgi:drug/metabolite transporter (DMT)-like permease|nr:DMT family transporter [Rhodospirillaceae bacterium]MBT4691449.1 DMT family transporter [Rhodospirillaceae bacterium]MBT5082952.1 DMT family transporter [Rhodospirillaceae bacterium]MBT5524396.1 DMT family transporter [Rhodospirillaceae bacterium]MBT5878808.1 DMT family transporter [Rhodospirillaceae bacterium]